MTSQMRKKVNLAVGIKSSSLSVRLAVDTLMLKNATSIRPDVAIVFVLKL